VPLVTWLLVLPQLVPTCENSGKTLGFQAAKFESTWEVYRVRSHFVDSVSVTI
jgi:hypothetical protein